MNKMQNVHSLDRLARILLAELALIGAFFWLSGAWQIAAYVFGFAMLATGIAGFCGLYKIFGINTKEMFSDISAKVKYALSGVLVVILAGGTYGSLFFTKKIFIEDFGVMNNAYKQTLYNTGQDNRQESIRNYEKLLVELPKFQEKYRAYKPFAIRSDVKFDSDIAMVTSEVRDIKDKIYTGDLKALHIELEGIKNIFQDILKRNHFSMLGIAMLDFHDSMEVAVEAATAKNAAAVTAAYPNADERLKAVEAIANDSEIQAVRANLETLNAAAKNNQIDSLPKLGSDLKSSFVKTYLKRG